MNSKNFNAAEKHFEKKEMVYKKEIKELKETHTHLVNYAAHTTDIADKAYALHVKDEQEIARLNKMIEKYEELGALSKEDVAILLTTTKAVNCFETVMGVLGKHTSGFTGGIFR